MSKPFATKPILAIEPTSALIEELIAKLRAEAAVRIREGSYGVTTVRCEWENGRLKKFHYAPEEIRKAQT